MSPEDLENRFTYHAPNGEKVALHSGVRGACRILADLLNEFLPEGREKSLAITHLEEVMMWANASIARDNN